MICTQCPRKCAAKRDDTAVAFCGVGEAFQVAKIQKHLWEEPPISGTEGSGTIFFSGCNLRCIYCQNRAISRAAAGERMSDAELGDAILRLSESGVHNINLVTPSHYTYRLARILEKLKPRLTVPIVWNSSCYEAPEALRALDGLVDIYLPDFKYFSTAISSTYSAAPDYFEVALEALREMLRQVPAATWNHDHTLLLRGVIVRHLVLPGCRKDSGNVLRALHREFGSNAFLLSLMGQYTPEFAQDAPFLNLRRKLTSFEYESVLEVAASLGFDGFSQDLSSATSQYTPNF